MKITVKISSLVVAILCCILFSLLTVFVFDVVQDRARLFRDNVNEQIFSRLFTSLRDFYDYGSAIEASPTLQNRIIGLAIYREDLTSLYSWGNAPAVFDDTVLNHSHEMRNNRYTIAESKSRSIKFILNIDRRVSQMPSPQEHHSERRPRNGQYQFEERSEERQRSFFFSTMDAGKYFYIEIYHPDYWRTIYFSRVLFVMCELALLFIIFYIRNLFLRNIEYRKRIEDQKSLVVLGTAASTLAHEIKNPLLSIRLQTGILRKIFTHNGNEKISTDEIRIIEEEVERISSLVYRVNDYLRDAVGFPNPIDVKELLQETFYRLSEMNIVCNDDEKNYSVFIDADRARSVFENIIRNALESGGAKEKNNCSISKNGNQIIIEISDKGKGISQSDMTRIFDPFFTSKSTGTGIGLSISKRFIEAANGSISLQSKEGEGTLVKIIFPEYTHKD
jgi:two-component system sensor histidine kinase HydH